MLWKVYSLRKKPKVEGIEIIVQIYKGTYFKGASCTERKRKWIEKDSRGNFFQRQSRGLVCDQGRPDRVKYVKYYENNKSRWS